MYNNIIMNCYLYIFIDKYYRLACIISKEKSEWITKKSSVFPNLWIDILGINMLDVYYDTRQ